MLFRESETIELKEIAVDDIKKKLLPLLTVTAESYTSAFETTEQ